jgi:antitoxin ParD1/3/4
VTEDCHAQCHSLMATMNVSLPDELKSFVDQQVAAHGYASTSEYLRNLIRKQRDIEQLREMLLEGASSSVVGDMETAYFDRLRQRARMRARK